MSELCSHQGFLSSRSLKKVSRKRKKRGRLIRTNCCVGFLTHAFIVIVGGKGMRQIATVKIILIQWKDARRSLRATDTRMVFIELYTV